MMTPDNIIFRESFTIAIADEHIRHSAAVGSAGRWYSIDGLCKIYMILVELVPFVSFMPVHY
jgi:hypothetical protein